MPKWFPTLALPFVHFILYGFGPRAPIVAACAAAVYCGHGGQAKISDLLSSFLTDFRRESPRRGLETGVVIQRQNEFIRDAIPSPLFFPCFSHNLLNDVMRKALHAVAVVAEQALFALRLLASIAAANRCVSRGTRRA
jgi:hypothetical protein